MSGYPTTPKETNCIMPLVQRLLNRLFYQNHATADRDVAAETENAEDRG